MATVEGSCGFSGDDDPSRIRKTGMCDGCPCIRQCNMGSKSRWKALKMLKRVKGFVSYQATSQPTSEDRDKKSTDVSDESRRASCFCVDFTSARRANCMCRVRSQGNYRRDNVLSRQYRLLGCQRLCCINSINSWNGNKIYDDEIYKIKYFHISQLIQLQTITLRIAGWCWLGWNESICWWILLAHYFAQKSLTKLLRISANIKISWKNHHQWIIIVISHQLS